MIKYEQATQTSADVDERTHLERFMEKFSVYCSHTVDYIPRNSSFPAQNGKTVSKKSICSGRYFFALAAGGAEFLNRFGKTDITLEEQGSKTMPIVKKCQRSRF